MTELEVIALLFGVAAVILTIYQSVWCWAAGIVNATFYAYIFYENKLFGDAVLQVFYIFISYYGWYQWVYGGTNNHELPIRKLRRKELITLLPITLLGITLLSTALQKAGGDIPVADAITTVFSVMGTWMMAKKIYENWLVWVITDAVYVILYIYKGLYLTSLLYFLFTILAILGWIKWKKSLLNVS